MQGFGGNRYVVAREGRLFVVETNPLAVGPDLFGALAYSAMTPFLVLRNPPASGRRAILQELAVAIQNVPAQEVHVRTVMDRSDRFVTLSGIQRTPRGSYTGVDDLATVADRYTGLMEVFDEEPDLEDEAFVDLNGVASSPRSAGSTWLTPTQGGGGTLEFNGGRIINPGHLFAAYVWADATAPQVRYSLEWIEERIQT